MTDQIMTVSEVRFRSRMAIVSDYDMQMIEQAIKIQLSLRIYQDQYFRYGVNFDWQ